MTDTLPTAEIQKIASELLLEVDQIKNVKINSCGFIDFQVNNTWFWAKLTSTGKFKKNSIRRDNS